MTGRGTGMRLGNKKNQLLIYAHYYIPDTASTGQILRELAEGLLDQFDVTIICTVPSYLGVIEEKYKKEKGDSLSWQVSWSVWR